MKKVILSILITIAGIYPSNANEINDIDWVTFDWAAVTPDQYTIGLANMYSKIWNHMDQNKGTAKVNEHIAPGFDTKTSTMMTSEYQKALDFFGVKSSNITYFSENSQSWFPQKMLDLDGWHNSAWLQNNCFVSRNNLCGMATDQNNFYHMIGSNYSFPQWQMYVAHHESAHGFQNSFGLSRPDRNNQHPNCWIREGQADALALASYVQYYDVDFIRKFMAKNTKNILGEISYSNKKNMIETFKNIQSNFNLCFQKGVGYSVGVLLTEYMYINYSVNQVHNLIKDLISNYSFNHALQRNMKINETEFYDKSFDYIIESYERSVD